MENTNKTKNKKSFSLMGLTIAALFLLACICFVDIVSSEDDEDNGPTIKKISKLDDGTTITEFSDGTKITELPGPDGTTTLFRLCAADLAHRPGVHHLFAPPRL